MISCKWEVFVKKTEDGAMGSSSAEVALRGSHLVELLMGGMLFKVAPWLLRSSI